MKEEIIISAENLVKKYGKGEDEVIALNDVSMKIRKGEFISVTGESGSGKSTLLNVLGSLGKPHSGKLMVGDKDLVTMKDNDLAA